VDRLLETRQATPQQARAHTRQAVLSACLGAGAWLLSLAAFVVLGVATAASHQPPVGPVLLVLVALMIDACVAALGLGQAVAALRARGNHMILATMGLVLNGLYLGALIGLFSLGLWNT
jgi:hypothetical protein